MFRRAQPVAGRGILGLPGGLRRTVYGRNSASCPGPIVQLAHDAEALTDTVDGAAPTGSDFLVAQGPAVTSTSQGSLARQ